jgi:hypothetical protein
VAAVEEQVRISRSYQCLPASASVWRERARLAAAAGPIIENQRLLYYEKDNTIHAYPKVLLDVFINE